MLRCYLGVLVAFAPVLKGRALQWVRSRCGETAEWITP
jgi:hypothetical protein